MLWVICSGGRGDYTKKYYQIIEYFAVQLKNILGDDVVFVVISDHGIESIEGSSIGGDHSVNAYISFNRPVNVPEQLSILHIRNIIEQFLMKESVL